jgi:hypothetical protein
MDKLIDHEIATCSHEIARTQPDVPGSADLHWPKPAAPRRNAGHTRERPPSLWQNETEMMNQDYCRSVQFPAPAIIP